MFIIQILISKCPVKEEFDPLDHNLQEIKSLDGQVKHVKNASGQTGEVSHIEREGVITFYKVYNVSVEAGGTFPWSTVD